MNENKTERLRVERAEAADVAAMFTAADVSGYRCKKFTPVSDVSHLEIYQYVAPSGDKLSIVYDTKARILTADGKPETLAALKSLFPPTEPAQPSSPPVKVQEQPPAKQPPQNEKKKHNGNRQKLNRFPAPVPVPAAPPAEPQLASKTEPPAAVKTPPAAAPATVTKLPARQPAKAKRPAQPVKANPPAVSAPQAQQTAPQPARKKPAAPVKKTDGAKSEDKTPAQKPVTVTGVSRDRLDWLLKDLKSAGAKVRATDNADKSRSATVQSPSRESVSLILTPNGSVTLAGKPGALFDDVKAKLESKSDLRLLKKHIPTALRYLSEPSKIDLSNGITDLNNIGKLSDYSVLLTAPYRALEKFIYDLQQAENINVKMIGQAYEKDDEGHYSLKKGYLKRIDSVIYAEVMTALYTEYFATRNFYTHSDNSSDSKPRGIAEKAEAQRQLAKLLSVIEYNAKKLSEIGFSVVAEH